MTSTFRYYVVDAFTDRPFAGNPAAVIPLDAWQSDGWLQNVAMEMNLSETTYLVANPDGYDLRWFTPTVEVDLCGHATLAAAIVLSTVGNLSDGGEVRFSTRSGVLRALRQQGRYELDFPIQRAEASSKRPAGLVDSLGVEARWVGRNRFDYLVEVASAAVVRGLSPDLRQLATVECRGVMVTAASDDPQFNFVSRFFAPAAGIDEDPVTGSAHCCLAAYWGERLGKTELIGHQVSRRGGIVHVKIRGERVLLGGEGVIVAQGELMLNSI